MTRDQALNEAINAAHNAKVYARKAENAADSGDSMGKVPQLTAVSDAWADTARSYAAIAAALPETTTEAASA
ncbi:hypothetical protein ACWGJ6_02470 [Streptomyces canus]